MKFISRLKILLIFLFIIYPLFINDINNNSKSVNDVLLNIQDRFVCNHIGANLEGAEISEGLKNYLILKKLYINWQGALFGSSRAKKRELRYFLIDIIGKEIETDSSYTIVLTGDLVEKKVKCKLLECRWLNFHGPADVADIDGIVRNDPALIKKWWRSGILFSISGKIKRFRFGRDIYGDTIELFLDKIIIRKLD